MTGVLQELWERIASAQPAPPAWVVAVTGLAALLLVLNTWSWRLAGQVITIAHEGGHALCPCCPDAGWRGSGCTRTAPG